MIVTFSLPLPLPAGKNINIWVPANYIEKLSLDGSEKLCGAGGWCLAPASSFLFKNTKAPLTTNLGKHDIVIVTTKAAVAAGSVTITLSALTMGPITNAQADGFKVTAVFDTEFPL
jgi:hypothetical protein